jgi:hypothetical protein
MTKKKSYCEPTHGHKPVNMHALFRATLVQKLIKRHEQLIEWADESERKIEEDTAKMLEPLNTIEEIVNWRNACLGEKIVHNCLIREITFYRELLDGEQQS